MRGIALTTEKKQLKKATLHREKYSHFMKRAKVHKKLEQQHLSNAKESIQHVYKLDGLLSELYPSDIHMGTRQLLKHLKNEGYFPAELCERDLVEILEKRYKKNNQAGWTLKTVEAKITRTIRGKSSPKSIQPAHDFHKDDIELYLSPGPGRCFLVNHTLKLQVNHGASLAECQLVTGGTDYTTNYVNNRIGYRYDNYELLFNDSNQWVAAKHL